MPFAFRITPSVVFSSLVSLLILGTALFFQPAGSHAFAIKNEIAILLAAALAAAVSFHGHIGRPAIPRPAAWALAAWILAMAVSLAFAANPRLGLAPLAYSTAMAGLFVMVASLDESRLPAAWINRSIVIAGVLMALYGAKQYFWPQLLDPGFSAVGKMRVYSTLGNPNLAAIFLAVAAGFTWQAVRDARTPAGRLLPSAALLVQLAGLGLTGSRSGLIALGVLAGTYGYLHWKQPWPRFWRWAGLAALAAMAAGVLYSGWGQALLSAHSLKGRVLIWLAATSMVVDRPFSGIGLGNFGIHYLASQHHLLSRPGFASFAENATATANAHHDFLQVFAETGVVGGAGLAVLVIAVLWRGLAAVQRDASMTVCWAGLAGLVVAALLNRVLDYAPLGVLFWVLAGRLCRPETGAGVRLGSLGRVAGIAFLGIAMFSAASVARTWAGNAAEDRGDREFAEKHYALAAEAYAQAEKRLPLGGTLRRKRANALLRAGQNEEALAELEAASRCSGDMGILYLKAEVLARLRRWEEAVAVYRFLGETFPTHVTPHFMLGQFYAQAGMRPQARREFERVIAIRPSRFDRQLNRQKVERQKELARFFLQTL